MEHIETAAQWVRDAIAAQAWLSPIQPYVAVAPDWAVLAVPAMVALLSAWALLRPRKKLAKRPKGRPLVRSSVAPANAAPEPANDKRNSLTFSSPTPREKSFVQWPAAQDHDDNRVVRVFVSSTFLDMQTERDELARKTFPALRARFRARGVELVDIDLRWGVRQEDVEAGRTLPICLAEVDRCRPYFIGLLGERYGSKLTTQLSPDLVEAYPALRDAIGRSVTEIEVMHGVLRDPGAAQYALFFERSPKWVESLPPAERKAFLPEDDASRAKVADLKAKIGACGARTIPYEQPADIAATVEQALSAALEARFPESRQPDVFELTSRLHTAYARDRRAIYVGGDTYIASIDNWINEEAAEPPLLVIGASGVGKSALVANWIARHRERRPKDIVFEHYLGASPESADPALLLRRLWEHLNRATNQVNEPPRDEGELFESLGQRLADAAEFAEARGAKIVIALDGLDKLDRRTDLRWLPSVPPRSVRVLASSLDGPTRTAAEAQHWRALEVSALSAADRRRFVDLALERMGKRLSRGRLDPILAHPLAGSPLFLRTLLDELRVSSIEGALDARLEDCLKAVSVPELFTRILRRLEGDCGAQFTAEACALIWAGRAGLEETRIAELTGAPMLSWAVLRNGLGDALRDQAGRVTFGHDFLREAVRALYVPDTADERRIRLKIADYFESQPQDERQAEELPYQLRQAQMFERLERLLTDLNRFPVLRRRGDSELLSHWLALDESGAGLDLLRAAFFEKHGADVVYSPGRIAEAGQLAGFLLYAGDYRSALGLAEWALKVRTETLGPYHPDVFQSLHNVAHCCYEMGDTERAREIEERLVSDEIKAFGQDDPRTLQSLENLAMSLDSRGEYARALELLERVANARSRRDGEDDLDALRARSYAASTMVDLGRAREAELVLRVVLEHEQRLLGEEHVETLRTKAALAQALEYLGQYRDAIPLRRSIYAIRARLFGPRHKLTLMSAGSLARTLFHTGEGAEARSMMQQLLTAEEQIMGAEHSQTLTSKLNYASMLYDIQAYSEARKLEEEVVAASTRVLGPTHTDTLLAMKNLGATLKKLGEHEAALILKQRATEALTQSLGPDHPLTLSSRSGLALTLFDLGRHEEARSMLSAVVAKYRELLGADHPDTLIAEENLAHMLSQLGDRDAAVSLQTHVVESREEVLGKNHPYAEDAARILEAFKQGGARGITVEQLNRALAPHGYEAVDHPVMTNQVRAEGEGRVALLCRMVDNPKVSFNCMLLSPDGYGGRLSGVLGMGLPSDWRLTPQQLNEFNSQAQSVRFAKLSRRGPDDSLAIEWDFVSANLSDTALSEIIGIWIGCSHHIVRGVHEAMAGRAS